MKQLAADIVVISAGTAGLAAAVAAAEEGASVIALEKNSFTGGTGNHAGGPFAVESKVQRMKQILLTREEAFQIHMDFTQWRVDARLVKAFIDKSASTIDWLEDMGIEFSDVVAHNPGYNFTWHVVKETAKPSRKGNRAVIMMDILAERARALGVQILLQTPVKKILKDNGQVTGVMAEDESGGEIRANARAVIIATGGFGGIFPPMIPGLKGDGIHMAKELGAAVTEKTVPTGGFGGGFQPGRPRRSVNLAFGQPNLVINLLGERFMNEEFLITSPFGSNAVARQKDGIYFTIFDEDTKQYYVEKNLDLVPDSLNPINKASDFDDELKEILDQGSDNIFAADSLKEMAGKIGINPDALRKTIDEYNTACETGRDNAFNKNARYLRPVKKPKFYASKYVSRVPQSMEGIRTNYKTEVLTEDYDVIPGLYAAGTDAMCNVYADMYPIILPGNAFGFCINSGRIAAENAVEYIKSIGK